MGEYCVIQGEVFYSAFYTNTRPSKPSNLEVSCFRLSAWIRLRRREPLRLKFSDVGRLFFPRRVWQAKSQRASKNPMLGGDPDGGMWGCALGNLHRTWPGGCTAITKRENTVPYLVCRKSLGWHLLLSRWFDSFCPVLSGWSLLIAWKYGLCIDTARWPENLPWGLLYTRSRLSSRIKFFAILKIHLPLRLTLRLTTSQWLSATAALASSVSSRILNVMLARRRVKYPQSPAPSGQHAIAVEKASSFWMVMNVFHAKTIQSRCHHLQFPTLLHHQRFHWLHSVRTQIDSEILTMQWQRQLIPELTVPPTRSLIRIRFSLMNRSAAVKSAM